MYRCDECHEAVDGSPTRVVLETREKVYEPRFKKINPDGPEVERNMMCVDKGGKGWEIVKEANLCPKCLAKGGLEIVKRSLGNKVTVTEEAA